jgi:hypothetical protein
VEPLGESLDEVVLLGVLEGPDADVEGEAVEVEPPIELDPLVPKLVVLDGVLPKLLVLL